jgi:hypothetical protein
MADTYEDLPPVLHDTTDATLEGDAELTEELAATATIDQLMDEYIMKVSGWFIDLNEVSEQGNPVKTHIAVVGVGEDVVSEAYFLRTRLLEALAKKGEEIATTGMTLTKQVLDEEN